MKIIRIKNILNISTVIKKKYLQNLLIHFNIFISFFKAFDYYIRDDENVIGVIVINKTITYFLT